MYQNLDAILQQFNYGKNSFIVLARLDRTVLLTSEDSSNTVVGNFKEHFLHFSVICLKNEWPFTKVAIVISYSKKECHFIPGKRGVNFPVSEKLILCLNKLIDHQPDTIIHCGS